MSVTRDEKHAVTPRDEKRQIGYSITTFDSKDESAFIEMDLMESSLPGQVIIERLSVAPNTKQIIHVPLGLSVAFNEILGTNAPGQLIVDEKYFSDDLNNKKKHHSIASIDLDIKAMPITFKNVWLADSFPDGRVAILENHNNKGKLTIWNLETGKCELVLKYPYPIFSFKIIGNNNLIIRENVAKKVFFQENPKESRLNPTVPTADLDDNENCCTTNTYSSWRYTTEPFASSFGLTSKGDLITLHSSGKISINSDLKNALYPEKTLQYRCCVKVTSPNASGCCRKNCRYFCCGSASTEIDFGDYRHFGCSFAAPLYAQWSDLHRLTDDLMLLTSHDKSTLTLLNIHLRQFSKDYKLERPPGATKWEVTAANQFRFIANTFFDSASFNIYRATPNLNLEFFSTCTSIHFIRNIKPLCSGTGFVILNDEGVHLFDLESKKVIHSYLEEKINYNTFHVRQEDGAVVYFSEKNKAGIIHYQREVEFFEYKKELQAARAFRLVSKKLPDQKHKKISPVVNLICKFVTPDYYGKFFKSRNQSLPLVEVKDEKLKPPAATMER